MSRDRFEALGLVRPLVPDEGVLACEPGNHVIFTPSDQSWIYAVNGSAKGTGRWLDLDPIWAPSTEAGGLKVDVSDLIDQGLDLCG